MVRERLGEVINREPDLRVCGEAEDRFQVEVWRSFSDWLWTALTTTASH